MKTIDAALRLVEEIRNMKNMKKDPLMVLLDLQKVFDSADHKKNLRTTEFRVVTFACSVIDIHQ